MGSFTSKGFDIDKGDIIDALGKPPPDDLVPIGDSGIYISPHVKEDRPVSPFNCEEWPDSPYCGGNPWTRTPAGFEDIEFGASKCGIFIAGTPVLAWTKMAPISVGWIAPGCRAEYGKRKQQPPPPDGIDNPPEGLNLPSNIDPETQAIALIICTSYSDYSRRFGVADPEEGGTTTTSDGYLDLTQFWNDYEQLGVRGQAMPGFVLCSGFTGGTRISWSKKPNKDAVIVSQYYEPVPGRIYAGDRNGKDTDPYKIARTGFSGFLMEPHGYLIKGRWGDIYKDWNGYKYFSSFSGSNLITYTKAQYSLVHLITDKSGPPTPDDDYKKRKCCMQCCQGSQAQERRRDEENGEILKLLKEIKKAVGVDEFPVKLPASLISKDEGFVGNLIPNPPASEENIPRLIGRFIRYFDEIMGQWEIPIEIKDADPTKPGDQPKGVKLHNIAECLADMYGMAFDSYLLNQQLLQLNSKNLIETGMTKQNVVQNYYALMCLVDFFGFKYREIEAELPLSFKPGEEEFEKFLKDSTQKLKVFDLDVNDKNVVTYKDDMFKLLEAAQIIKAVHFRKLDHKGDMKQQIIDLVKLASQYAGKVKDGDINPSGEARDDFADWLEDAETEFSRKTGVNTQNPYGRPYDQRPRLTILDVENPTQEP